MQKKIENKEEFIATLRERARERFPELGGIIDNVKVGFGGETKKAEVAKDEVTKDLGINLDLRYMESKNEKPDEQLFVFMHEVLHIVWDDINARDEKEDPYLWNRACDAVRNHQVAQMLGMPIPSDLVNIPEAKGKKPREVYKELEERQGKKSKVTLPEKGHQHSKI